MESTILFYAYLLTWLGYVVGIHAYAVRKRLNHGILLVSHAMPSLVAVLMAFIFLIGRGATVRQFVGESENGMDLWSLWLDLWPVLLFGSASAALVNLVWTITACMKKTQRKWLVITAAGTVMSVFAFFTVALNFPDA